MTREYELEWTVQQEDVREALVWRFWHTPKLRIVAIIFCLCGIVGVLEIVLAATGHGAGGVPTTVVLLALPLLLFVLPWLQARSVMRNNPALREPTRMRLSADGIRVDRRTANAETAWNGFTGVQETRRSYLLRYVDTKVDLLIPKRAVEVDRGQFRSFLDEHVTG
ncbi:MAG TPA: YcxB family protein [Mycobacteriales bacterium]|nr:YcxB family protein [Mycobacteriales bacterium]